MNAADRFRAEAAKRILLTDGAFGTMIQGYRLTEEDYRGGLDLGFDQKGNNDLLVITRPHVIAEITEAYLDAGSDMVSTNTFNANRISQADYGAEHLVRDMNIAAAQIARDAARAAEAKDGRPRFVAGALGPTNKTLSLSPDVNDPGYRAIEFDELKDVYRDQIDALLDGGVDFILIETIFDTLNAKAGIMAALEAGTARGADVPLMISFTVTDMSGRNLSGHSIEAFWATVRHARPLTIGLNCSFGAPQLRPHVAALSAIADTLVMVYPNAGLPNDLGQYDEEPETTGGFIREWADTGLINVIGGCCGTTPQHIAAMRHAVHGAAPRPIAHPPVRTVLAGLEPMILAA
ncbi:homocysteine S-methyltransferase family protein [Sphingomonas sp. KC8]|uniref:homocysteine S-methyltransferase family protein n=1 Tax=Sphingomonas sp. KC8 TaxID=1030157 RepID=UPI0002488F90|nr:homocysteine S-methyltransferase family protein [Sphingomonas sp. KC8]ARS29276.1 5-methyltetrahydrofolate--homocysteine methyltransferase [Sphingomonas sp. KC8]